ncbi:MAG TPA: SBBP repeat-containing protein [Bryobacteraceae bacterium]|nr:SBBP repeat-containing protein [Bryobacteraceae bacterium]
MPLRFVFCILLGTLPVPVYSQSAIPPTPGLIYSTYLRNGFTPSAAAADAAGNVYLAGSVVSDAVSFQTAAMVVKLNPKGSQYIYVRTLGGSLTDSAAAIAVDNDGNAYVTGSALSPDFPVTAGRRLATPSSTGQTRTFLAKLDPQGSVLFSELLGGASTSSIGQAVALTPQGEIVVSGTASPDFPVTTGAYAAAGKDNRPYLMKLDNTGASVRFAAFGIGGSALSVDAAGNIYMAGATELRDYPTTPGVYQPVFKPVTICFGFCRINFPATNQYLTKVDATGSKLIYSTAVAGGGQTTNGGLALDAAGNAYLTGFTYGTYPYTTKDPGTPQVRPFLTKIDANGQNALYSIPIGGVGVSLDGHGNVFVGGTYNNINLMVFFTPSPQPPPPPGVQGAVQQCVLNGRSTFSQAYASQVDAATGNVQATVLVDGSNLSAAGIALVGDTVWIAGNTTLPDVPMSAGAINDAVNPPSSLFPGGYLGLADFTLIQQQNAPQVGCILDAAGGTRLGPVAPHQLISIFGTNLGPAQGVGAPDAKTTSLAGVTVTFDGVPARLLYVSQTQINVAVPPPPEQNFPNFTSMQVFANGPFTTPRTLPVVRMAPNLFAIVAPSSVGCSPPGVQAPAGGLAPLTLNQDGTINSCDNPAKSGSVVSFFVDGLGGQVSADGGFVPTFSGSIPLVAQIGNLSVQVVNVGNIDDYVSRIDVRIPDGFFRSVTFVPISFLIVSTNGVVPVGPRGSFSASQPFGVPLAVNIWVAP